MTSATFDFDTFLSPFTYRYGSPAMRAIWSERHKRALWRRFWVALAEAESEVGLVSAEQVADLRAHAHAVDIDAAHRIEAEIHHDLMAEVKVYAGQCAVGGGIIHLGATSMDVEDNVDALRLRESLRLVLDKAVALADVLAALIDKHADAPTMAFTHLQPAEPTTTGYRLAQYALDLQLDLDALAAAVDGVRGKGLKGAAGTSASYAQLLEGTGKRPRELEHAVMSRIGLQPFPVATQVAARKQEYTALTALAGLGQTLYRFAFDLRLLQSPPIGEWQEPFASKQVGSSAMPFKRNPINAENMNSLARHLAALPRVAWDNAAHCLLERTLDDSGNRRSVLPEACLIADELLRRADKLLKRMRIDERASARLLDAYGTFAATERVMMEAARRGADRQVMHEIIREHALAAWAAVQAGAANPLADTLCTDERLLETMTEAEARGLLRADDYVGDAPERAREMAAALRATADRHRGSEDG